MQQGRLLREVAHVLGSALREATLRFSFQRVSVVFLLKTPFGGVDALMQ